MVLPGAVVEQARQAVGAAQGQQFTFVAGQGDGLAVADPAQGQGIQHQDRQAGIQLGLGGHGDKFWCEQQQRGAQPQCLRHPTREQETRPADGDVVHAHHRQGGDAGQRVEVHRANPEPTAKGIEQQAAAFAAQGIGRAQRTLKSQVRPRKGIDQHPGPHPQGRIQRIHAERHAHKAERQPQQARFVQAQSERKSFSSDGWHGGGDPG